MTAQTDKICHRTVHLESPRQCRADCAMFDPLPWGCLEVLALKPHTAVQEEVTVEYPESKAAVNISWAADNTILNVEAARWNADRGVWEMPKRVLGGWDWVAIDTGGAVVSWEYVK